MSEAKELSEALESALDIAFGDDDASDEGEGNHELPAGGPPSPPEVEPGAAQEVGKDESKSTLQRGPDGRFLPKSGEEEDGGETNTEVGEVEGEGEDEGEDEGEGDALDPAPDAPDRFSDEAKRAWTNTPEAVKAEVTRSLVELENGLHQYREQARHVEGLDDVIELAQNGGYDLQTLVRGYVQTEQLLQQDILAGLDYIARGMGIAGGLGEVVGHVSGEAPDETVQQARAAIAQRDQEIMRLRQEVETFRSARQNEQRQSAAQQINEFLAKEPNAAKLRSQMAQILRNGMATTLPEAYRVAVRLYGDGDASPQPRGDKQAAKPAPTAQTRRATKAISGGPGSGNKTPSRGKPAPTVEDALQGAFSRVGI